MTAPDLHSWALGCTEVHRPQALGDVDEVAVQRACAGDRTVPLNRAEMASAFLWLDSHGYSHRRIAAILGVTDRTVSRWRSGRDFPCSRMLETHRDRRRRAASVL